MFTSDVHVLIQSSWVEVSGWDEDEIFFVERAELGWDELAGKLVTLRRMLSEGSIIFVRPIKPIAINRANPIPYEAEFVGCGPEGHQFRLNGVKRRHAREKFAVN